MTEHEHGFVEKCLVSSCAWQTQNQCLAPAVSVGNFKQNHDCVTWIPREENEDFQTKTEMGESEGLGI